MKKISYFLSMAAMLLFAACSSDVDEYALGSNQNGDLYTINVSMPDTDGSRVNTSNLGNLTWEEGDFIYAIGFTDAGKYVGFEKWTMTSAPGTQQASFRGNKVKASLDLDGDGVATETVADKYKFMYSLQGDEAVNEFGAAPNTDYQNQVQNGQSTAALKNVISLQTPNYVVLGNTTDITLAPQCPILRLNVKSLPASIKDAESLTFSFYVNYGWFPQPEAKVVYNGKITEGGDNFIYFAFAGGNTLWGEDYKYGFEIKSSDKTITVEVPGASKGYNFGEIYTAVMDYSERAAKQWKWEGPGCDAGTVDPVTPVTREDLYTETFDADNGGFVCETEEPAGNWTWIGGAWKIDAYGAPGTVHNRIISPEIPLTEKNQIEFNQETNYFADITTQAFVSVREVTTNADESKTYGDWINFNVLDQEAVETLDITGFDNKVVQIAFYLISPNGNSGAMWQINEFKIKGVKAAQK